MTMLARLITEPVRARTWRETGHLLVGPFVSVVCLVFVAATLYTAAASVTVIGLVLLAAVVTGARSIGAFERARQTGVGVLLLSQYVVDRYAAELLSADIRGIGYLLKDRVADIGEFLDAVDRVGSGGTVLDPEVVRQLLGRTRRGRGLDALTERERQVLTAMAEGRSNASIAMALHISEGSVEKHVASIFAKLELSADRETHRRVLAVVAYLRS
ncbi:MAG: putative two-component system response regulator [Dactylosporangium sp.]|jgi:DNA-binding NarL/FixJ family response regulator|nr:putative two-component system response regulator [Dactylosporangium sp.]